MGLYPDDRAWSDKLLPQAKGIISRIFEGWDVISITQAPSTIDNYRATDIIVRLKLANDEVKEYYFAFRVRKSKYFNQYKTQFTIRSRRDSGYKTELTKIVDEGHADAMLYCFVSQDCTEIEGYRTVNLDVFRKVWGNKDTLLRGEIDWGMTPNGDGTYFHWFDVRAFPPELVKHTNIKCVPYAKIDEVI